ncbi:MAG: aspartate--tRNA ligase [Deltaproteobacteria bacterium]|nr:aspartate--tRNA ligase [Deltaproteobacteria bacterium]
MTSLLDTLRPNSNTARSHHCNELSKNDLDNEVVLMGWVNVIRDAGGVLWIDLRDREGLTQLVFNGEDNQKLLDEAKKLRPEWCIAVRGTVKDRVDNGGTYNNKLATGEVEISVLELEIFNQSITPPFEIKDDIDTGEALRLKHRVLDLRRPKMQKNLRLRHKITSAVRRYYDENGFLEVETPHMVKYTPGGARNFLVPRSEPKGAFYALAESPQLYKQMLMMAGVDRYFQIVRCFRDEELRGDRQPEFTQIDVEMSFVTEPVVQKTTEGLIKRIFRDAMDHTLPETFPRMTYDEAMERFGSDKPDVRFGLEHTTLTELVKKHEGGGVPFFASTLEEGGMIKAMRIEAEHAKTLSRKDIENLEKNEVQTLGGKGLGRARIGADGAWMQSPFAKQVSDELRLAINDACDVVDGDVILFQFGKEKMVQTVLGGLRLQLGARFGILPKRGSADFWAPLWITEFPLFEYSDEEKAFVAAHHPFSSPEVGHEDNLINDPGSCKARAYDLVLNGNEIGGGSVRIHDDVVQAKVFAALGIGEEEQQEKFGFLLEALRFGAPPHAGIALGLDRLTMLLAGAESIRDVIAYPKQGKEGKDALTGAPTMVSNDQLEYLNIKTLPVPRTSKEAMEETSIDVIEGIVDAVFQKTSEEISKFLNDLPPKPQDFLGRRIKEKRESHPLYLP